MAPMRSGYAPTLDKLLKSLKHQSLETSIEALIALLRRRQVKGDACATATAHILLQVVAKEKWNEVNQLLVAVQKAGRRLVRAAPHELVIGNVTRRVLGLIRDEAMEDRNADALGLVPSPSPSPSVSGSPSSQQDGNKARRPGPTPLRPTLLPTSSSYHASKSMYQLLRSIDTGTETETSPTTVPMKAHSVHAFRSEVIDGIEEILDEISQVDEQIAAFADQQIHPDECVLVYQPTATVERFLARAASKKRFTVFIVVSPTSQGKTEATLSSLRKKLTSAGVKMVHVSSSGMSAYMPRVTKVILGAKSVLFDGSVLADGGCAAVARAAHEFSKPVICLSGVHQLCPEEAVDLDMVLDMGNPSDFVSYADGSFVNNTRPEHVATEIVSANFVDIYITSLGAHAPCHLSSVMADHYKAEDIDFHLD